MRKAASWAGVAAGQAYRRTGEQARPAQAPVQPVRLWAYSASAAPLTDISLKYVQLPNKNKQHIHTYTRIQICLHGRADIWVNFGRCLHTVNMEQ